MVSLPWGSIIFPFFMPFFFKQKKKTIIIIKAARIMVSRNRVYTNKLEVLQSLVLSVFRDL